MPIPASVLSQMENMVRIDYLTTAHEWLPSVHCSREYLSSHFQYHTDRFLEGKGRRGAVGQFRAIDLTTGDVLEAWNAMDCRRPL